MSGAVAFKPDYATSAGAYLQIVLDELGMTQADLAARTGLSSKHINQIIKRGLTISPETATQLEYATDVPAETWAGLDARHQAFLARGRAAERFSTSLEWLDRFNLSELAKRGIIETTTRTVETMVAVLRFFGISDPEGWERVWRPSLTSFRRSPSFKPDTTATTIWLRAGQRAAARIETAPYDQRRLLGLIDELRGLTRRDPEEALPLVQELLAEAGVALVLVAEFDGCRASGATWWASPTKAVIILSNRGKREDRLWFSLFHELGHVLRHAKRDTFIDQTRADDSDRPPWADPAPSSGFIDDGSRDSAIEQEADEFAGDALIPPALRGHVSSLSTPADVQRLADQIGVSPGVVAGRYQYETGDYRKFNSLRREVPQKMFLAAP
jgi:plasmid maintenance system antidote protein VapI/Zn-dependent peptidase ImmA (M78 family)